MRIITKNDPKYPGYPFKQAIDLANVSSILNNRGHWEIKMENGEEIRMVAEGEGLFESFVDACQAAKTKRDLADTLKRRR
jgi:hypothetical protein